MAGLKGYLTALRGSTTTERRHHARHSDRRQRHEHAHPDTAIADLSTASGPPTGRRWGEWSQPQVATDDGQLIVRL